MKHMRDDLDEKSNMFSSEHLKRKFKAKIYLYDKSFEKQEEELIYFKEEHYNEFIKFYQDPFNMKGLPSTLSSYLLKITLRAIPS